jgi:hypothetical protein
MLRHFLTPSGRHWTVDLFRVTQLSLGSGSSFAVSGSVLRFSSDDGVTFDLEDWPSNWDELSDEALAGLLKHAALLSCRTPSIGLHSS